MSVDTSLFGLFAAASLTVQLVMVILLGASVASWYFIILKWKEYKRAEEEARSFEERFWSGIDLVELYRQVASRKEQESGLALVFEAGFREFARQRQQEQIEAAAMVEGAGRAMRVSLNRQADALEKNLSWLATIGSTSPYIGLFGTVWGIMNSFRALAEVQQASLTMVAPGIAEALIATAMGLFAAIPAVIAYNRYMHASGRLLGRYEGFIDEFSNLLHRQAHVK